MFGKEPHGMSRTKLYRTWAIAKARCTQPSNPEYYLYGARGITFCEGWLDFHAFKAWSLANGYAEHLTLVRDDSARGYEPGNCRWDEPTVGRRHYGRYGRLTAEQLRAAMAFLPVSAKELAYAMGWKSTSSVYQCASGANGIPDGVVRHIGDKLFGEIDRPEFPDMLKGFTMKYAVLRDGADKKIAACQAAKR